MSIEKPKHMTKFIVDRANFMQLKNGLKTCELKKGGKIKTKWDNVEVGDIISIEMDCSRNERLIAKVIKKKYYDGKYCLSNFIFDAKFQDRSRSYLENTNSINREYALYKDRWSREEMDEYGLIGFGLELIV